MSSAGCSWWGNTKCSFAGSAILHKSYWKAGLVWVGRVDGHELGGTTSGEKLRSAQVSGSRRVLDEGKGSCWRGFIRLVASWHWRPVCAARRTKLETCFHTARADRQMDLFEPGTLQ